MKISENKKRQHLISIIKNYLLTSKALMEYYHSVADTKKEKLTCNKSIKAIEKSLSIIDEIKHIEILDYLYAIFIGNNAIAYSISGKMVLSPKIKEWDTDDGVKELIALMEEKKKKNQEKFEQQEKTRKAVEEAKKQGKRVEMVYDKETKTVKPVVVKEKSNA